MNSSLSLAWSCPVCYEALHCSVQRWHCDNGHSFDIAKSGYANLLLANQRASKQPGDNPTMLRARRAFLNAQYFRPIAQAVSDAINRHGQSTHTSECPRRLLDIGCGEGYYLRHLRESLHGQWLTAGLDIAKEGVQLAAKSDEQSAWVCASSARIPLQAQSLDVLLRIFAPSAAEQAQRVLAENGLLVSVTPAGPHLLEIKQALYAKATLHEKPVAPTGFTCVDEQQVKYSLTLREQEHIQALLSMTPFFWRGNKNAREQLLQTHTLEVCIAVWVSCYRKTS